VAESAETFRGYEVRRSHWAIAGHPFELTWPADVDALLDLPETQRRFDQDEYMPYWAQPWPAAVLLAEKILQGERSGGRQAVEIGCGVGLVSLAAAASGWSIVASDYDVDATAFAELNARRNHLTLAGTAQIDYRRMLDRPAYDCILGADLAYERRNCEPVANWIASALKPGGQALICDPNRSAANKFPQRATEAGLTVDVESLETKHPEGLLIRGRIWRLTW
jgi:predicted nicotinamide N-methyase